MNTIQYTTHSVEETLALGHSLGRFMKDYENPICIALDGTLGAGKTHFSQGIAKGFGVTEEVTSPTFALMNTYEVDGIYLYHFDLYRMDLVEELETIGFYEYTEETKSVVEWAGKFTDELPDTTVWIEISVADDGDRQFTVRTDLLSTEELQRIGEYL
ncbi:MULTISPECIES: tRNA (adenosine(37)-N6)-threonylcarbamoyltransferase complex ATPase subunit type 1 TsaE [unclassified Veillonella]|uniref:tRNA (adenosine(37)-N6)-threonylcarbamoyltransferase complex ATPase subunit type 1 TsaE n=1 Tax=unclassified Veillonella TaxID=2630086 RepID=UPI000F8F1CB8|nr:MULTISPECIES: tRNA (adenosine(37)-N6)-threonylcarbamoyltransferase complex ATPase subunit type 1 TsaE [unclassified Veillonella]